MILQYFMQKFFINEIQYYNWGKIVFTNLAWSSPLLLKHNSHFESFSKISNEVVMIPKKTKKEKILIF